MHDFLNWISTNVIFIGLIAGIVPTIIAALQFISVKKAQEERVNFETYHSLIRQLVERDNPNVPMRLDRQIAVIYELRNFEKYFPVTYRIFTGLKEDWTSKEFGPEIKRARLMAELDLSLQYIESKVETQKLKK